MPSYEDLSKFITGEWAVIAEAPASFVVAVLTVAFLTWLFLRLIHNARIAALNERINLRDDQLANLQLPLHAASPSDALVKLGELTAKVESLSIGRWDPLTEDQIERLKKQLEAIASEKIEIQITDDARALGHGIDRAFEDAGWEELEGIRLIGGAIGIEVSPQSEKAEAIANALRVATGLDVKVTGAKSDRPPLKLSLGSKPFYR